MYHIKLCVRSKSVGTLIQERRRWNGIGSEWFVFLCGWTTVVITIEMLFLLPHCICVCVCMTPRKKSQKISRGLAFAFHTKIVCLASWWYDCIKSMVYFACPRRQTYSEANIITTSHTHITVATTEDIPGTRYIYAQKTEKCLFRKHSTFREEC